MTSDAEYRQRMKKYDWEKLEKLWNKLNSERRPIRYWDDGKALEYLIIKAFELDGAQVEWPYEIRTDQGIEEQIDGVIYSNGISCLIECKDQRDNVNIEPIAKLRNQLLRRPASAIGSIFITSEYTDSTVILASHLAPQTILLWFKNEIDIVIRDRKICDFLMKKYKKSIERGIADYNIAGDV
jgi:hypothetical protein